MNMTDADVEQYILEAHCCADVSSTHLVINHENLAIFVFCLESYHDVISQDSHLVSGE